MGCETAGKRGSPAKGWGEPTVMAIHALLVLDWMGWIAGLVWVFHMNNQVKLCGLAILLSPQRKVI